MRVAGVFVVLFLCALMPAAAAPSGTSGAPADTTLNEIESDKRRTLGQRGWHLKAYLDLGYVANFNHPGNGLWRSKSTSFEVNAPRINMAMAYLYREAVPTARWGGEFGLQGGVDTDGLVPGEGAVSDADVYQHFYRANLSYLFNGPREIRVTGGLINSYIAYESYHAIENLNYTRGYLTDNVPYFFLGFEIFSPVSESVGAALFTVTAWNYLQTNNGFPSFGGQVSWQAAANTTVTQNLYYGPEQRNTELDYWRFFSDSIVEWRKDPFLVAGSLDVGTEKNALKAGQSREYWAAGALWLGWHFSGPWIAGFRPEFYWDPDGVISGAEQTIQAYTATLSFISPDVDSNRARAVLEYRFDRSTGPGGGFYKGEDNRLVPDQHQVILSLMWRFDR